MRAECAQAVVKALGRSLTKAELDDIEQRITRAMRNTARQDPVAWQAKPQAERLQEAAKSAAMELVGEQVLKQKRAALTITTRAAVQHYLADQKARGVDGLDALDRLIAFHADNKSHAVSLEKSAQAIENRALSQMLRTLEASDPKWFGLFENRDGVAAIVKEIFGEASGKPEAAAGAKLWHEVTSTLRERFNRAGGDVGELEDWGPPFSIEGGRGRTGCVGGRYPSAARPRALLQSRRLAYAGYPTRGFPEGSLDDDCHRRGEQARARWLQRLRR